jgi:hypothetical protein
MKRLLLGTLAAVALSSTGGDLRAQCVGPNSVAFTDYGRTCDFFGQPANLNGVYDQAICTLFLRHSLSQTCCNTFPVGQVLMLGVRPVVPGIRDPLLVPGCVLSVVPEVVLIAPFMGGVGNEWRFRLPRVSVPVTLFAQGINLYFTTIGFTRDFQTTNGVRIDIR